MNRVHHRIPRPEAPPTPEGGRARKIVRFSRRLALSAASLAIAGVRGAPGIGMHARCARFLVKAARGEPPSARNGTLSALLCPMDSVRYFEFAFAWRRAAMSAAVRQYLDVSSPRLFPLCLLEARPRMTADLVNPDTRDLEATRALVEATGLQSRCVLHAKTIDVLEFCPASFDLITSISVLEHIPSPGDTAAVERLWSLLRPGGRLIVTVPVAREGVDEYLDIDEYGLLPKSADGWCFGQRLHDSASLQETFFRALGEPSAMELFGERISGAFVADRAAKIAGLIPPWKESLRVASTYAPYASLDALPGWGVVGLEFVKPR